MKLLPIPSSPYSNYYENIAACIDRFVLACQRAGVKVLAIVTDCGTENAPIKREVTVDVVWVKCLLHRLDSAAGHLAADEGGKFSFTDEEGGELRIDVEALKKELLENPLFESNDPGFKLLEKLWEFHPNKVSDNSTFALLLEAGTLFTDLLRCLEEIGDDDEINEKESFKKLVVYVQALSFIHKIAENLDEPLGPSTRLIFGSAANFLSRISVDGKSTVFADIVFGLKILCASSTSDQIPLKGMHFTINVPYALSAHVRSKNYRLIPNPNKTMKDLETPLAIQSTSYFKETKIAVSSLPTALSEVDGSSVVAIVARHRQLPEATQKHLKEAAHLQRDPAKKLKDFLIPEIACCVAVMSLVEDERETVAFTDLDEHLFSIFDVLI